MRKLSVLVTVLLAGTVLCAQDEAALRSAMKQIGPTCSGLGKKITAKDSTATDDAKKLATWFGDVEHFWHAKNASDGVTFSKNAAAEFKTIGELTAAAKWDDAGASFKKALGACSGCHNAHREKAADGSWKIK
jgi:cytochrome c556